MLQIIFSHERQWYLLLSQVMYQFRVGIDKCCNYFFLCNAMVSSNIIPLNVNFVTAHETGKSSAKIIKKFRGN